MRFKGLVLGILGCGMVLAPQIGRADTLQLESTGNTSVGGVYIYPYNFSVNGSSASTSLMCLNYDREITQGQKWDVTVEGVPMGNTTEDAEFRADAWLYSLLPGGQYSASDIQFAVWSIFDPGSEMNPGFDTTAANLATQAGIEANDPTLLGDGFYSGFTLYIPTGDDPQDFYNGYTPQEFIGGDPGVTPEPSSLALLGTGVLGAAGVLRRKYSLA